MKKRKWVLIGISTLCLISIIINIGLLIEMEDSNKYSQSLLESLSKERFEFNEERSRLYQKIYEDRNSIIELENENKDLRNRQQVTRFSFDENVMYKMLEPVYIYSHMSDNSAIVGDVSAGETVEVLNSFFSDYWKIRYKGIVGWIKTDNRDIVDQLMDVRRGNPSKKTMERVK